MKHYEVIKGNVGGFGNKTHTKGSTVTDAMFPNGNAKTLETMGFLKETKAPKKEVKATKKTEAPKPVENTTDSDAVFLTKDGVEVNELDDCNKAEIMDELKSREIEFNPMNKKAELFKLLVG